MFLELTLDFMGPPIECWELMKMEIVTKYCAVFMVYDYLLLKDHNPK